MAWEILWLLWEMALIEIDGLPFLKIGGFSMAMLKKPDGNRDAIVITNEVISGSDSLEVPIPYIYIYIFGLCFRPI